MRCGRRRNRVDPVSVRPQTGQSLKRRGVVLRGCLAPQRQGLGHILGDAFAGVIFHAQAILAGRMSLIGRLAVPLYRLLVLIRLVEYLAQARLRRGIAAHGGSAQQTHSGNQIAAPDRRLGLVQTHIGGIHRHDQQPYCQPSQAHGFILQPECSSSSPWRHSRFRETVMRSAGYPPPQALPASGTGWTVRCPDAAPRARLPCDWSH